MTLAQNDAPESEVKAEKTEEEIIEERRHSVMSTTSQVLPADSACTGSTLFGEYDVIPKDIPKYEGNLKVSHVWRPYNASKSSMEKEEAFETPVTRNGFFVNVIESSSSSNDFSKEDLVAILEVENFALTYEAAKEVILPATMVDKSITNLVTMYTWPKLPFGACVKKHDSDKGDNHGEKLLLEIADVLIKKGTVHVDLTNTIMGHPQRVENEIRGYLWGVQVSMTITTKNSKSGIIEEMKLKIKKTGSTTLSWEKNITRIFPHPVPAHDQGLASFSTVDSDDVEYRAGVCLLGDRDRVKSGTAVLETVSHQYVNALIAKKDHVTKENVAAILNKEMWGIQYCLNIDKRASTEKPDLKNSRCVIILPFGLLTEEERNSIVEKLADHLTKPGPYPKCAVVDLSSSPFIDKFLVYRAYGFPVTRRIAQHSKVKARFILVNNESQLYDLEKMQKGGIVKLLGGRGIKFPKEHKVKFARKFNDTFSQFLI